MPYNMNIYVDGACRGNGQPGATGAAAAVFQPKYGKHTWFTRVLPHYPTPTNQRAEIMAIILALEEALNKYDELDGYPRLYTRIYSDSKYAVGCMTEWIYKWIQNDWTNSAGNEVANRGLIERASDLVIKVRDLGPVEYIWISGHKTRTQIDIATKLWTGKTKDIVIWTIMAEKIMIWKTQIDNLEWDFS
jgi:ribonuclease HI